MAVKKSEIYSSLWKSCDELRGGMDASQYKDYILVLLFMKYVSDRYAGDPNALIEVPPGGGFADMVALRGDKDIGDKINTVIARLAEANDLRGVIDVADFNDDDKLGRGKEKVDRLSNLVAIFANPLLDFRANRADGDDILGDAYEYLMRHFATESGKSKGQFYTPAEVSRIMAKVIGAGAAASTTQTIYDPTCGSGSLLLKVHDEAPADIAIFGQEMDNATAALARMNMILHNCPTAEIHRDNTLSSPYFKQANGSLKTFDFVVANPPFSTKAWSNGFNPEEDAFNRFPFGIPPAKNGDYAFLLHVLASLKSTGKGAIILPHGVLFRGNAEADIRRAIIARGTIKGIIGLPANLFYGTGIPACIVVLDKENAAARRGIYMIDASKGFLKDGNKNRLRAQDIHKIVDAFTRLADIPRYARMVPVAEIMANDGNLNLPRYIDISEPEDIQDIGAHLHGGIPLRDVEALAPYWQVFSAVRVALFAPDRPGYLALRVAPGEIKPAIFDHAQFAAFTATVAACFAAWKQASRPRLAGIRVGDKPKALIETLSETLLGAFANAPLLDAYDVYQHLMGYWASTMQDDAYLLAQEGWEAVLEDKPNTDLIPPALIVARFFAAGQAALDGLEAAHEAAGREVEEYAEEQGGEDGLLADARNDKGKLTAKSVKDRLEAIRRDRDAAEERAALKAFRDLLERETEAKRVARNARAVLEAKVLAKYASLNVAAIKALVVDDKWLATLEGAVQDEVTRVSQALTGRIRQLAERYAATLPQMVEEISHLATQVDAHILKMGTK